MSMKLSEPGPFAVPVGCDNPACEYSLSPTTWPMPPRPCPLCGSGTIRPNPPPKRSGMTFKGKPVEARPKKDKPAPPPTLDGPVIYDF